LNPRAIVFMAETSAWPAVSACGFVLPAQLRFRDSVGSGGIADLFVPAGDRELRGQNRRTGLVAVFADFPEVAAFGFDEGSHGPVVDLARQCGSSVPASCADCRQRVRWQDRGTALRPAYGAPSDYRGRLFAQGCTPRSSCRRRANGAHTAHHFETVTIYYRWHPLFGQTLRVRKHMKNRRGEHIFCELPDGTICSLPKWMFSPDCMRLSLGRPVISVEALVELRDVLTTLRLPSSCDKSSLERVSKEGENEATSESNDPTAKSVAQRRTGSSRARGQTKRPGSGTHGAVDQRRLRKHRKAGRRRRP